MPNYDNNSNNGLDFILIIIMVLLSLAAWIGSGWFIWNWINVDSFIDGVKFFLAWTFIGGIVQSFIVAIVYLPYCQ